MFDKIAPILTAILITTTVLLLYFLMTIDKYYVIEKNDIYSLGTLYEREAIDFDDSYAPLVEQLKVYSATDNHGNPLQMMRYRKRFDGGYVAASQAFQESDALMGYGIADDISFEEAFSESYHKPSFGFDCGISHIAIKNDLCHFIDECLGTDRSIYETQKSTHKISSYSQQLQKLKNIYKNGY